MAKPEAIPGVAPDAPFAAAAAQVVAARTRELSRHASRVLDLDDIEGVHDMRVATRRLRAALEVFAPCFPKRRRRAALREVKALADALGERRDRDVTITALERIADGLVSADRPGVESLVRRLRAEQEAANAALAPLVAAPRMGALRRTLTELVREAQTLAGRPEPLTATELAAASARNGAGVA